MADNFYATYTPDNGGGGGAGVSSLNGLTGALALMGGTGVTITPSGDTITIDATGTGANTALSNLVATAINVDLVAGLNNIINVGSPTINYLAMYTASVFAQGAVAKTANTTSGSATISGLSSTTDLHAGMSVNGSNIPHNAVIATLTANSITMVNNFNGAAVLATSSLTGTTITFLNSLSVRTVNNSVTSSSFDTGEFISRSGDITGSGSSGNTGQRFDRTGDITSATASGATGAWSDRTGNNSGSGNSGSRTSRSGNVTSGTSGSYNSTTGSSTTGTTGPNTVATGNSSSGGTTGPVILRPGTTSGTRGDVKWQDGSEGFTGYVVASTTADGVGRWTSPDSLSASLSLDNIIGPTSITANLVSQQDPSSYNTFPNGADLDTLDGTNQKFAQPFSPNEDRSVGAVILGIKNEVLTLAGNLVADIYSDNAGSPDMSLGSSDALDATTLDAGFDTATFTFSTPVAISAGTQYWVVVSGDGAYNAGSDHITLRKSGNPIYVSGADVFTGSWAAVSPSAALAVSVRNSEPNSLGLPGEPWQAVWTNQLNTNGSVINAGQRTVTMSDAVNAATDYKILADTALGGVTLTLPQGVQGQEFVVKNIALVNAVTMATTDGDSIETGKDTLAAGVSYRYTYDLDTLMWWTIN